MNAAGAQQGGSNTGFEKKLQFCATPLTPSFFSAYRCHCTAVHTLGDCKINCQAAGASSASKWDAIIHANRSPACLPSNENFKQHVAGFVRRRQKMTCPAKHWTWCDGTGSSVPSGFRVTARCSSLMFSVGMCRYSYNIIINSISPLLLTTDDPEYISGKSRDVTSLQRLSLQPSLISNGYREHLYRW